MITIRRWRYVVTVAVCVALLATQPCYCDIVTGNSTSTPTSTPAKPTALAELSTDLPVNATTPTPNISTSSHIANAANGTSTHPAEQSLRTIAVPLPTDTVTTTTITTTTSIAAQANTTPTPVQHPSITTTSIQQGIRIASTTTAQSIRSTSAPEDNCAGHRLLAQQPTADETSRVVLCSVPDDPSGTQPEPKRPNVPAVAARFFHGCIENVTVDTIAPLPLMWSNGCMDGVHTVFEYGQNGSDDRLFVLQNGSLLRTDRLGTEYDVFDTYCLAEAQPDHWLARVCYDQMVSVSRAESYLYAICMLVSVPCLLCTAFLYLTVPQLRNLHGKSLACHSLCLALGFLLLSVVEIRGRCGRKTGYVIQYMLLACFMWLAVMCVDICTKVWYFVPHCIAITKRMRLSRFLFYATLAHGIPLLLVAMTAYSSLPGKPSYFLKGVTDATRGSQQYFIPPVSSVLFVCLMLQIAAYFGFRRLDPRIRAAYLRQRRIEESGIRVNMEMLDIELYNDTKQIARSTAYLYIIMTINWMFEIITFYMSASASVELFDILNALQGIVIFIIFVSLPRPFHIIKRWWMIRGDYDTKAAEEMKPMPVRVPRLTVTSPGQTRGEDVETQRLTDNKTDAMQS